MKKLPSSLFIHDIDVNRNDIEENIRIKKILAKEFEIKNLGSIRCFLGIKVARSDKGIFLSNRKYVPIF